MSSVSRLTLKKSLGFDVYQISHEHECVLQSLSIFTASQLVIIVRGAALTNNNNYIVNVSKNSIFFLQ